MLQISVGKVDVIQEPGTVNVEHKMQKFNDFLFWIFFKSIEKLRVWDIDYPWTGHL